jgi:cell division protein FtsW
MVHKVAYHYFKAISKGALYIVWILLAYTLIKGTVIAGANASRWIQVPFIGLHFKHLHWLQWCYFFVARYLSKTRTVPITLSPPFGSSGCLYSLRYYLFFPQISQQQH